MDEANGLLPDDKLTIFCEVCYGYNILDILLPKQLIFYLLYY